MEGLVRNFVSLPLSENNCFLVMVCLFSYFWCNTDLAKWVKFVVSGHFMENTWKEWPQIRYSGLPNRVHACLFNFHLLPHRTHLIRTHTIPILGSNATLHVD